MIKVESLEIVEFRGIRKLTLEFRGGNFAVGGPNGTGKSGIVDAIEFALTGNISRLSGAGTGGVSVKDHAPHVDSRNRPDKAYVKITVSIPSLKKKVTIERSVKDALSPKITPNDPDVAKVLEQIAQHPEFVLSRRELIRYVLSAPGERAKEVQALLRLDQIEQLRATLQKIANACTKGVGPLKRETEQAKDYLLRALEIAQLTTEALLAAVNQRRAMLGLPPIAALAATTSLRDGLSTLAAAQPARRVSKIQAAADIKKLRDALGKLGAPDIAATSSRIVERLKELSSDAALAEGVTRESLLNAAIDLFDGEHCPVCDTGWAPDEFRAVVAAKLKHLEDITKERRNLERQLEPIVSLLGEISAAAALVAGHGTQLKSGDLRRLADFRGAIDKRCGQIEAFLPLPDAIAALTGLTAVPAGVLDDIAAAEAAVAKIPEPTQQDAARDYLTVADERLEAYRRLRLRLTRAQEHAELAQKIFDTYAKESTDALDGIYKQVEKDFGELYSFVNRDDEAAFTAKLTPSLGKLGFDVDFYGRGHFPPGAYHSEGHQDSMGLCLYLALMKHLLGDGFTFAVLDDVLMSVDAGHRREVCALLKERFPNTQFVLTTHDGIWLRHMKTAGLIGQKGAIQFKKWDVAHGPTEWDDRDVWAEIADALAKNDVRAAAGLLRHYLEYVSSEICHHLRAPVEYRGDAQFQLGDLMPSAIGRLRELLKDGRVAAQSWGQTAQAEAITRREERFTAAVVKSGADQWQVNPAIHYNEWVNLSKEDFAPVVEAFRAVAGEFFCAQAACQGMFYVVPERGQRDTLRCACSDTNINLKKKPKEPVPIRSGASSSTGASAA